MDQSFYNQPSGGQQPQQPPAQQPQQPQPVQPSASTPFETPLQPQTPPPGAPPSGVVEPPSGDMQPVGMGPAQGGKSWILIIILVVVLILGVLFFASWQGWISLGGLEKLWTKTTPTTEPITTTPVPTANANDLVRKQDLTSLKDALKKYYLANQSYPVAETLQKTSDTTNALTVLVPNDIAILPVDPLSPTFYYGYKSDGKTFELTAALEDKTDPAGIQSGSVLIYKVTDISTETPTATTTTNTTTTDTTTTDTTTTDTTTTDTTSSGATDATGTTTDASSSATSSGL